ncbi:MAG: hypothetical protein A3F78_05515 [Burkholderiales bacterium RIFCSPLOWO2_12_FULL_61_40]|nr:MAG: hypothetical protein A3F78_05515 [Burkholderiales bacterium RIFCSPLOWO2_12_FULL_61_40]
MTAKPKPVRIIAQQDNPALAKGQKAFNTLVEKIALRREQLAQWQTTERACVQKVTSDFMPLMQSFHTLQASFVQGLNQVMDKPGLTKTERQTVHDLICSLAANLLDETDDEAVKAIYNKYSGTDFGTEEALSTDELKDAMAQMFGVDADAMADAQSPQEMLEQMLNRLGGGSGGGAAKPRKKTAKQLAKEAQQQIEADKTSLSIREVYRKLVSALHPDREPDLDERTRKTALMQRVNQAYDKKDLLRLLELQLELEHIDASTIAGLSDERLKHYNKVLKEQLAELDMEIGHIQLMLKSGFQMPPYETLTLASVMPRLAGDIADLKRNVRQIKEDIARLDDPNAFKAWIKGYRRELRAMQAEMDASDEFPFFR